MKRYLIFSFRRDRRGERAVDVAGDLWTGSVVIDRDCVASDRDLGPHGQRCVSQPVVVDRDEEPFAAPLEKMPKLRPAFDKNGF